jgi:DNA-binding transcriptional LysR family regulator
MLNLTMRRFQAVLAIADNGTFAAAADVLGISQPSVSGHIQALERQLGGAIFQRGKGRRPVLTELGRTVVGHARELLASVDHMQADLAIVRSTSSQRVTFSCQRSLANFVLRKRITDYAVSRPDTHLMVSIGKQEDVIREVRDGSSDVGCFLSNEDIRGLRSTVIGYQRLVLVVAADNPLAGRRKIKPEEVRKHDFVAPPLSSLFGRTITKLLTEVGIAPINVAAQATEYHFLRELVAAGLGISCSPATSVASDVAAGTLAILDLDAPSLQIGIRIVTSPTRHLSPAAQSFADYLAASPVLRDL